MPLISNVKRLQPEDFDQKEQELIEKIGLIINPFMDEVFETINGRLDYSNLQREYKTYTVKVDVNGKPTTEAKIATKFSQLKGIICIRAINQTNSSLHPTSQPFVSYDQSTNSITVSHISGLQTGNSYLLVLEFVG